jgi:hypothetical protein
MADLTLETDATTVVLNDKKGRYERRLGALLQCTLARVLSRPSLSFNSVLKRPNCVLSSIHRHAPFSGFIPVVHIFHTT